MVNAILSTNCKCIVTVAGTRHQSTEHTAVDSSQRFATAWRTPDLSDPTVYGAPGELGTGQAGGGGASSTSETNMVDGRAIRDDFHASFVSAEGEHTGTAARQRGRQRYKGGEAGRGRA